MKFTDGLDAWDIGMAGFAFLVVMFLMMRARRLLEGTYLIYRWLTRHFHLVWHSVRYINPLIIFDRTVFSAWPSR